MNRAMKHPFDDVTVAAERTRYYQESREGIYTGPLFVLANFLQGLPLSAISTLIATFITFRLMFNDNLEPFKMLHS